MILSNEHFSNVAQVLAQDIPLVDVNPESCLERTNCSFSLQTPSVSIVLSFLKKLMKRRPLVLIGFRVNC